MPMEPKTMFSKPKQYAPLYRGPMPTYIKDTFGYVLPYRCFYCGPIEKIGGKGDEIDGYDFCVICGCNDVEENYIRPFKPISRRRARI